MAAPAARKNGLWAAAVLLFTAILSGLQRPVIAQADTGQVTGTINFLDAGLTALGAFSAFATTLARRVLHVECPQRDYVWVKELFVVAGADKARWHVANGPSGSIMFTVLASEKSINTGKQVIAYISTASKHRGEVAVVRGIANCPACLLCATDSKLILTAYRNYPTFVVYGCEEGGALSLLRCSPCVSANRWYPNGICPAPGPSNHNVPPDEERRWTDLLSFLGPNRFDWELARDQLLLVPLPVFNTQAVDSAVVQTGASKDEDSRGDLQPLLRTLEAGNTYSRGPSNSTASLSTSIHYMGLLELVVACFLAILF